MGRHLAEVPGSLGDLPQHRVPVEPLLHDVGVQARFCNGVAPARPVDAIPLVVSNAGLGFEGLPPGSLASVGSR